jgi:segregation and condensation protein B
MRRIRLAIRRTIVSELDPTKRSREDVEGSREDAESVEIPEGSRGDAEGAESEFERIFSADSVSSRDDAPREQDPGELDAIVEALIFASPEPLTPKALGKLLSTEPAEDVTAALARVAASYERPGGLQMVQVAGGYQIVTRPELHEWVRRLFHEQTKQKLSVQALETLSVIAYKQPVTAAEITEIRGVNTSGVLNTLIERQLIKIAGRKQVVGRPFLYATTREFLDRFGLKDLADLPRIEDMADALGFEPPAGLTESQDAAPVAGAEAPVRRDELGDSGAEATELHDELGGNGAEAAGRQEQGSADGDADAEPFSADVPASLHAADPDGDSEESEDFEDSDEDFEDDFEDDSDPDDSDEEEES